LSYCPPEALHQMLLYAARPYEGALKQWCFATK